MLKTQDGAALGWGYVLSPALHGVVKIVAYGLTRGFGWDVISCFNVSCDYIMGYVDRHG